MTQQNNDMQVNIDEVINNLAQQIAQLSATNAILTSQLNQYKQQADTSQDE